MAYIAPLDSHCSRGHEMTSENTYRIRGGRRCRACTASFPNQYVDRTHCKKGHPFTEENTYWQGKWRRCRTCRVGWGRDHVSKVTATVDGTVQYRQYHTDKKREWYLRKRETTPKFWIYARYGITPEEYAKKLADQMGLCAICRKKAAKAVDHCHVTGRVRDLLCQRCNLMVGFIEHDPASLIAAAAYVQRWKP